jgi:hypothetical protein
MMWTRNHAACPTGDHRRRDRTEPTGATTFRAAFEGENTPEDMARYLSEAFTPAQQAAEIISPANVVCSPSTPPNPVRPNSWATRTSWMGVPNAVSGPAPLELKRLYVARAWR